MPISEVHQNAYIYFLNIALAAVHYGSAIAISVYGESEFPQNKESSLGVYIRLWQKIEDGSCSRDLFVEDAVPTHCGVINVPVYWFCSLFGAVSGTYHFMLALWVFRSSEAGEGLSWWGAFKNVFYYSFGRMPALLFCGSFQEYVADIGKAGKRSVALSLVAPQTTWATNGYRWFDYAASTSLMIVVIYVSFGILDAFTCLLASVAVVLLMVLGYTIEQLLARIGIGAKNFDSSLVSSLVNLIIVGFVALVLIFAPIFINMDILINSECNDSGSEPPSAVQAVGAVLLVLFMLFGLVPCYQYYYRSASNARKYQFRADLFYSVLSMWAKTFLHWGLATIVIGQSTMVQGTYDKAQEVCTAPEFVDLWSRFGYVISATLGTSIATLIAGFRFTSRL